MKAVLIFHNVALDGKVHEAMHRLGVQCYSKFPGTLGRGALSEPHLATEVWPESNNATMVVADESTAAKLMEAVREMRKTLAKEGIKAFMWTVEDSTE